MHYDFTVEVGGKTYKCSRDVRGHEVLHQIIYVDGVGKSLDPNLYGVGHFAIDFMQTDASHIAIQMVEEYRGSPQRESRS